MIELVVVVALIALRIDVCEHRSHRGWRDMGHYNPLRQQRLGETSSSESDSDSEESRAAEFSANEAKIRKNSFMRVEFVREEVASQMSRLRVVHEERMAKERLKAEMEEIKRRLTEMDTIENAYTPTQQDAEKLAERAAEAMLKALDAQLCDISAYASHKLWSEHESAWEMFTKSVSTANVSIEIRMQNVPWPPDDNAILTHMAAHEYQRLSHSAEEAKENATKAYKKAFRKASLRWHPDKFMSKFGKFTHPKDADEVYKRVQAVSQAINDCWRDLNHQP